MSSHPYLSGVHAPVFDERDAFDLKVEGEIPRSLNGVFMRNGPNPLFEPCEYNYPFDGTGMIHAIYMKNGKASYRNRWVRTQELQREREAERRIFGSAFGPAPVANLANTNIVRHGGRYMALYEGGLPYEMDRELNTLGAWDYGGALPDNLSAHPRVDPETGELVAVSWSADSPCLNYMTVGADGVPGRIVTFEAPWTAMIHDIGITRNYVVVLVCPWVIQEPRPQWKPWLGSAVAVIPRRGTERDILWFECEPFFHFHVMNAFESGPYIELQLPWHSSFGLEPGKPKIELHTLRINLDTRTVVDEPVDDCACEFPRINDNFAGRQNRYGYVGFRNRRLGEDAPRGVFEAVARYDFATGARTVRTLPRGQFAGEPVFAPEPGGTAEDAGFVMTIVQDECAGRATLDIFDARHLAGSAAARIVLPRRVPAGLHGSWMPEVP